ncbi:hypothetical protein NDU88_003203 [Pleurodeles waltl]|uniref:Uncharacterized protein n=1 Tax=Pleurodeles waltl TaxID=8319 RepID=A0AAV7TMZ9_PLEWA|nr:hypothetical protein NDU88_003203 [Pleurodeles waltl]
MQRSIISQLQCEVIHWQTLCSLNTTVLAAIIPSSIMAGYEEDSGEGTYYDDSVGPFEQDLVYALDAGARHTVNLALAHAVQPIKHHLLGFAEQQGRTQNSASRSYEELPFSQDPSGSNSDANPHLEDFEQMARSLAKDHDYFSA